MYDPISGKNHDNFEGRGIQIMSIDNLPTELPLEASEYFSTALIPHVTQLVKGNFNHPPLARATITTPEGKLVERHERLYKSIETSKHQRVLLLGSGYVAAPLVDYLLCLPNCSITIASNILADAQKLAGGRRSAEAMELNIQDKSRLQALVDKHDIVVSFVPATLHPVVAEACLATNTNMVTASYISPALASLDARAKASNVTFLNEVGLDPGIDHLTAMKLFDEVKAQHGRITAFKSWCGGLPAPEASNNPLGYKFSWSPKGVLLAGLNSAKYKLDGKLIDIPGDRLLKSAVDVNIYKGFALEGIPNRDSLKYADLYGLGPLEDIDTMFRGTLRYKGYCELMAAFKDLGLLTTAQESAIEVETPWPKILSKLMGVNGNADISQALDARLSGDSGYPNRISGALNWLGLLSFNTIAKPAPSVLDAFCDLLQQKLVFAPAERDMVAMQHEFGIEWSTGKKERRTSTLIAYGDPGIHSAMAKTVGLPAAIATDLLLSGNVTRKGVIGPMTKDVYVPMLEKLTLEGIKFEEITL
ncbi:hypothetical protein HDV00_006928 [Rhizophlyctis rosea]|nr:hypothetical protein HDV00_006928 [Rhizophlyctis rosea]